MATNNHYLVTLTIRVEGEHDAIAALEISSDPFVMHGVRGEVMRAVFDGATIAFEQLKAGLGGRDHSTT